VVYYRYHEKSHAERNVRTADIHTFFIAGASEIWPDGLGQADSNFQVAKCYPCIIQYCTGVGSPLALELVTSHSVKTLQLSSESESTHEDAGFVVFSFVLAND
jgi:hypothetical protein